MLLGVGNGRHPGVGGEEIVKEISNINFGKETHLLFLDSHWY